ncbi:hypothetical protein PG997_004029 [Apiospora hydei]|uniref:Cytochrome P450 n=1 Tax=Apiospora hydei TaxID=1337664 RepID=A0ABR1X0Y0_9PEZI
MAPPASVQPSRELVCDGMAVKRQYIPASVHARTMLYYLSYIEEVYPDPFKFNPGRWIVNEQGLIGSPAQDIALAERGFCSFFAESRGCPGKNQARLEMSITMAKIIFGFEMMLGPTIHLGASDPEGKAGRGEASRYQTDDTYGSMGDGPMTHLKRRKTD